MLHLRLLYPLTLLMVCGCVGLPPEQPKAATVGQAAEADSPASATYRIAGRFVSLSGGRAENQVIPGAASRTVTEIFGEPVAGDLDGDGTADAALLLVQQTGGSGSFFHLAAALQKDRKWQGSNAVFLGDRIAPQELSVRNGLIIIRYAEHRPGEPMAAAPTSAVERYFLVENDLLLERFLEGKGAAPREGWVTIGHEVREILLCGEEQPRWLMGDSPAYGDIRAAHRQAAADLPPYAPVFMILSGEETPAPGDGFGADCPGGFRAAQLLKVASRGHCRSEWIRVDAPSPGTSVVKETIEISGQARGPWFFEGDFPLLVIERMGSVVARHYASAQGPWMTRGWVPFRSVVTISQPYEPGWGWLVLKKDNPTDRRELDDEVRIPVFLPP
ncbi:Gmad2 immunoglobulin-like domain-containing protein [Desulfuromonas sp. TF]|uniref:Gmad2 immunoglobulin-like domain-containing protein n=1 Tax=Desulfuromonas sp. TF TaxID=1232410 RepID=UPI0004009719|nr:Gmad2 immunoglobulin-like domain-containing protein [Desulfuromonas sp. TF]